MGYEFFGEKNIFSSAPGINNDQSLKIIFLCTVSSYAGA